jgi:putative SOS response-associated peptidase YedK
MPYLAKIHNIKKRQPVILSQSNEKKWLSPNESINDILSIIDENIDENELTSYAVSRDLFSPKVDSNVPSILEQVSYPELTSLF